MSKRRPRRSLEDIIGATPKPVRPPGNSRGPVRGSGSNPNPHRDALLIEQARVARLKADQLAGKLVLAADVERQWTVALTDFRARVLAIPSRVGARMGLTRKQVADIDAELRATLAALASPGGVPDDGGPPTP